MINKNYSRKQVPQIKINGCKLSELSTKAMEALKQSNNSPRIFVMAGMLVRVRQDEKSNPIVETVDDNILRNTLERAANFYIEKNGRKEPKPPTLDILKDILAMEKWDGIPPLSGVIQSPIVKPDGDIITEPGYDTDTALYYMPSPHLDIPEIPVKPTLEEFQKAKALLEETIADFPFSTSADKENMLGLLITPFVRPLITGPVPLALISAPVKGSGKTLLGELVGLIATGHSPHMLSYSYSEEENRKKITAALLGGEPIIEFDNVKIKIDSGVLDSVLTCSDWVDRILGQSKNISIPQRVTWMANGNNILIGDELTRRIYSINLTPKQSRPSGRTDFRHKKLVEWVKENRGDLIWAILVMVRTWNNSGKTLLMNNPMGNFTSWVEIVGGILKVAGYDSFLSNMDETYDKLADEETQWQNFLTYLKDKVDQNWLSTQELCHLFISNKAFLDILPDEITKIWDGNQEFTLNQKREIGRVLNKKVNRRYGEEQLYIESKQDAHKKVAVWRVCCGDAGNCGVSTS